MKKKKSKASSSVKKSAKQTPRGQIVFMSNLRDSLDKALDEFPMNVSKQVLLEILLETYLEKIHPALKKQPPNTIFKLRDDVRGMLKINESDGT